MPLDGEYRPSARRMVREQVALYESSGGRLGTTLRETGLPVIIVSSLGASSGYVRKNAVMRVEHGGSYAAVASMGGADRSPAWYENLRQHPLVEVQDGPRKRDMVARELVGAERQQWWERAVDAFPDYADYQLRTTRTIPVFLLEPTDAARTPDG